MFCAILFCRCCTAGASYSVFTTGAGSVFVRYGGIFGRNGYSGYASGNISVRVSLVCGAGLLYEKWYNKTGIAL